MHARMLVTQAGLLRNTALAGARTARVVLANGSVRAALRAAAVAPNFTG